MTKSNFEATSAQFEKFLSERDKAQTVKEISEGLEIKTSFVYTTVQLMEVFGTVQKVRRGRDYYFLKGVYDDEQISAMLPPEKVKPKPRRKSIPRIPRKSNKESFLKQQLSIMREQVSTFDGPSALAMIGLQQEIIKKKVLTEELPRELETAPKIEKKTKSPIMIEPFATIQYLPKDVRRLTMRETKHLKEQLKGQDDYEKIKDFGTIFTKLSALDKNKYGKTLYVSNGTNSWDYIKKVTIDPSISNFLFLPDLVTKRWASWNDFLRGLKETRIYYGKDQYDKIIDQFMESGHRLVEMTVKDRKAIYVKNILNKRIDERGLEKQIKASYVTNWVYLEKVERS